MASTTFTINLGNIEMTQKRRKAYERAMTKEGLRSLGEWAKKHLDKAADFKESE
jgi:hypothetical protein